jgi:hypothetical protein
MKYKSLCRLFIVLTLLLWPIGTFAENIDPNDDGSQYAYGENVGWFNAEPLGDGGPGVQVNDTTLTGYIWAENIGWVSLSCENTASCATVNYGVANDGSGNLSGYGWSENVGWISFSCENTGSCGTVSYGVIIDPTTGEFSGQAWGENIGWVIFRSTIPPAYGVTTSWVETVDVCECDLNHDGKCDMLDWLLFGEDWGRTNCGTPPGSGNPPNDCECDLDKDGKCDMLDWLLFGEDWGRTDCPIP